MNNNEKYTLTLGMTDEEAKVIIDQCVKDGMPPFLESSLVPYANLMYGTKRDKERVLEAMAIRLPDGTIGYSAVKLFWAINTDLNASSTNTIVGWLNAMTTDGAYISKIGVDAFPVYEGDALLNEVCYGGNALECIAYDKVTNKPVVDYVITLMNAIRIYILIGSTVSCQYSECITNIVVKCIANK